MIIQFLTESFGRVRSLSSLAHFALLKISKAVLSKEDFQSPSSRGLGHRPFTAVTGVRIP
ncbi:hypothetical protein ALT1545_20033 [Alteromonas macleodii]